MRRLRWSVSMAVGKRPTLEVEASAIPRPFLCTSIIRLPKRSTMKNPSRKDELIASGPDDPGKMVARDTSSIGISSREYLRITSSLERGCQIPSFLTTMPPPPKSTSRSVNMMMWLDRFPKDGQQNLNRRERKALLQSGNTRCIGARVKSSLNRIKITRMDVWSSSGGQQKLYYITK
jgi:hypothetical protein